MTGDVFSLKILEIDHQVVTLLYLQGEKKLKEVLTRKRHSQQKGAKRSDLILTKFSKYRKMILVDNELALSPDDELYTLISSKLKSVPVTDRVYSDNVLDVLKGILQDAQETDSMETLIKTTTTDSRQTKAVPARIYHSAKVEDMVEVVAYPLDKPSFSQPLYPSIERGNSVIKESKPIQASDHAADTIDGSLIHVATNMTSENRPIMATSFQGRNSSTHIGRNSTFNGSLRSGAASYIPKPPRYPDYALQTGRTSSFQSQTWDVSNKPEVRSLVSFGFFYTGNGDLVRCYQCGIGLKDWIKDDDVMAEHIKYSSECDFLRQKIGKIEVERLKNALTSSETTSTSNDGNHGNQTTPTSYKIRSPRYQTMEARLASFQTFPQQVQISHQTLSVAGLFFSGNGDLCRCFTCDGGLKDWSTGDDPIQEHATYFPNCSYIIQLKGQEYIKSMQARRTPTAASMGTTDNGSRSREKNTNIPHKSTGQLTYSQGSLNGTLFHLSHHSSAALSTDELSIGTASSSTAFTAQVFQQLGYSEQDVIAARIELELKGNINPTSEDIVNTILDTMERNEQQSKAADKNSEKSDLKQMVEENQRLSEIVHCKLCVTGEPDILFLPCAHHKICHKCSENLTHCPICKKQIKEKVKTYRA